MSYRWITVEIHYCTLVSTRHSNVVNANGMYWFVVLPDSTAHGALEYETKEYSVLVLLYCCVMQSDRQRVVQQHSKYFEYNTIQTAVV